MPACVLYVGVRCIYTVEADYRFIYRWKYESMFLLMNTRVSRVSRPTAAVCVYICGRVRRAIFIGHKSGIRELAESERNRPARLACFKTLARERFFQYNNLATY